ncbi:MAG: ABC transporter permease subunit [Candidatus Heimdallarchaeota archaeon]|nr:ABC transporter permease subunit [Candidatus Heimdallarchaeota archaeon]
MAEQSNNEHLELEKMMEKEEQQTSRLWLFFKENRWGKYLFNVGKTLLPFIILAIITEIIVLILNATISSLNSRLLPPPHEILIYTWEAFFPGPDSPVKSVFIHIGRSFLRVLLGFLGGITAGILAGILMGFSKWFYRFLNPIFSLMISIPTLAWVPILLIIAGLQPRTIIITIMLSCFFPMVYNTTNGIRSIDKKLIWAAQIMGANKIEIFFDVLLPGSLVSIIAGLRLAVAYSWRAVVGAEILVTLTQGEGIGFYIMGARSSNLPVQIIVGILLIAVGGLLLDAFMMKPLEQLTLKRWGMIEKIKS